MPPIVFYNKKYINLHYNFINFDLGKNINIKLKRKVSKNK